MGDSWHFITYSEKPVQKFEIQIIIEAHRVSIVISQV